MDHLRSLLKTQSENDGGGIVGQNVMEKYLSGIKWKNWGLKKKREWIWKVKFTEKSGEEKWLLIKKLWRELNNY